MAAPCSVSRGEVSCPGTVQPVKMSHRESEVFLWHPLGPYITQERKQTLIAIQFARNFLAFTQWHNQNRTSIWSYLFNEVNDIDIEK